MCSGSKIRQVFTIKRESGGGQTVPNRMLSMLPIIQNIPMLPSPDPDRQIEVIPIRVPYKVTVR
jgi:hypothetical protein